MTQKATMHKMNQIIFEKFKDGRKGIQQNPYSQDKNFRKQMKQIISMIN